MSDAIDSFRYQTYEVDSMVRNVERPVMFLTAKFFPTQKFFTTPVIEWDIVEGGRRLAPFVSPMAQGRPMKSRGRAIGTISPAYIKPLDVVTPQNAFIRAPGEAYGGTMSLRQRIDLAVAEKIAEHRDMIDNRLEWMAAKIMTTGGVTISGEDYASVDVAFGQHSDLRPALNGADEWNQTTADPIGDIEDLAIAIRQKSFGAAADTIVMDGTAWAQFRTRVKDNKIFDATVRLADERTAIDATPRNNIDGELMGRIGGRFSVWVYDAAYEDDNGVSTKYLADYTSIVASQGGMEGRQYFGAIQDLESMQSVKHFVKLWPNKNPSGMNVLSQSAPVLGPRRPNAYGCITVVTP